MKENPNIQNPISPVIKEMKYQYNYLLFHNHHTGKNKKA